MNLYEEMIENYLFLNNNKTKTINASRNLFLNLTDNLITITRNWIVEYKQKYITSQVAQDNFRIMSIHY